MYDIYCFKANEEYKYLMNASLELDPSNRESPKPRNRAMSRCGLDCKEALFSNLADHSQLSILQTLCEGAKTDAQIATTTGLSPLDVSFHLERLLSCGCVKEEHARHSVLYGLSAPWLLQLEGIVDEMLMAALKGHRAPLNDD